MRDYTEEELKMLSDVLPNIALQLRTSLSTIYMAVRPHGTAGDAGEGPED